MALCPFAVQKLLPESGTQPKIVPRIAIMHSAAGRGSLYRFFLERSVLESHFWIGDDGTIEQYMDTERRADANLKANPFAVSIETESSVEAAERWTPAAAASLVRLLDWLCDVHPIPRRQCDRWDGAGLGWHIMFGAPGPWTPVAKSCPGRARVPQARDEIIPAVAGQHPTTPDTEDDDMALTDDDKAWIKAEIEAASQRTAAAVVKLLTLGPLGQWARRGYAYARSHARQSAVSTVQREAIAAEATKTDATELAKARDEVK